MPSINWKSDLALNQQATCVILNQDQKNNIKKRRNKGLSILEESLEKPLHQDIAHCRKHLMSTTTLSASDCWCDPASFSFMPGIWICIVTSSSRRNSKTFSKVALVANPDGCRSKPDKATPPGRESKETTEHLSCENMLQAAPGQAELLL